jgi:tetratricopeptide (TPR) repeat protein
MHCCLSVAGLSFTQFFDRASMRGSRERAMNREAVFRAALDHYRAARRHEAAVLLDDLLQAHPDDAEALLVLGTLRMDRDPDAGEALLTRCIALAPGHPGALHNLAKIRQQRGDHRGAVALFLKAIAANSRLAATFNDLGASLHQIGERTEALAAFDRALALDPKYTTAHTNRGFVLTELQRAEEARDAFRSVLACGPETADAWQNCATAHHNLEEYELAVDACRRAIALDPSRLAAYSTLALALHRLNRIAEAEHVQAEWARRQGVVVTKCHRDRPDARILLISAAEICNVPTEFIFDREHFETISLYLLPPSASPNEMAAATGALPDFDIAFNAVGDADRGAPFLERAAAFCGTLNRPLLNPVERIARTRRDLLPSLLADIPGLVIPKTSRIATADLAVASAMPGEIERAMLLRPIGSHGGDDLVRVERRAEIAEYINSVPADEYYQSEFWDFRSADGLFRKYRLIFVDRAVYPYHLAISKNWLVHYWRAEMTDRMQQEEVAFLSDFRSVFRGESGGVLYEIARRLDLDYAGMDCSILPDGRVLMFEANATMLVHLRESSECKLAHIKRIVHAMTDLIRGRNPGAASPVRSGTQ